MHDLLSSPGGDPACGARAHGCRRKQMSNAVQLPKAVQDAVLGLDQASRRDFLKASGALVISLSVATLPGAIALAAEPAAVSLYPDPDFLQIDTWIVIHPDNTA